MTIQNLLSDVAIHACSFLMNEWTSNVLSVAKQSYFLNFMFTPKWETGILVSVRHAPREMWLKGSSCSGMIHLGLQKNAPGAEQNRNGTDSKVKAQKSSRGSAARWDKLNRHKKRAHLAACRAVKKGKIKIMTVCELCGSTGKLHKHHADYSKPLDVQWLCLKCHGRVHWKS